VNERVCACEVDLSRPESRPESTQCHVANRFPVARIVVHHRNDIWPSRALAAYHFRAGWGDPWRDTVVCRIESGRS